MQITDPKVDKSLIYAHRDGAAWALMVKFGEEFVNPLAIFLGASKPLIALIVGLPQLIGPLWDIAAAEIIDRLKRRKLIILIGVVIQIFSWIPFALSLFLPTQWGIYLVLLTTIIYVSAGHLTAPAWASLMGDIVPADQRGLYFGRRNSLIQFVSLVAGPCAGLMLQLWTDKGYVVWGFACLFAIAALGRILSAIYLVRMHEPSYVIQKGDTFSFFEFLKRAPQSNFVHFVFYVAFITFSVSIASPFFAVYMLRDLHFSYVEFSIATSATLVGGIIATSYWGKLSDRFGNHRILTLTGWGVSLIPFIWVGTSFLSTSVVVITFIQAYAGIVWSGFNISTINFIFDAVTPPKRARCFAYYNVINGAAIFLGAMAGGFVAQYSPKQIELAGMTLPLISSFIAVFTLSGVLRILTNVFFPSAFKEVRKVEHVSTLDLVFQVTRVRQIGGFALEVVTFFTGNSNNGKNRDEKPPEDKSG